MKFSKSMLVFAFVLISIVILFNNGIFLKEEIKNNAEPKNRNESKDISETNFQKVNTEIKLTDQSSSKDTSLNTNYLNLHYDAILIDTHNDFIWKVYDQGAAFNQRNSFTQSDLPRYKAGGVDVQIFAVWIPMKEVKRSYGFTLSQIDRLNSFETENYSEFQFAKNYEDIIRITNEKKVCGLIGIEGGTVIGKDLDNIDRLYELGVRYIGLTWNNSNFISTSAKESVENGKSGGLSEFGVQVIKRMNEVGMLVDVSHLSEKGFWDVIETSSNPIIASHSNCYSINPHFRNLTDEQIKAISKNGGYIGINFYDEFLDKDAKKNRTLNAYQKYPDELNALNEKYGDDLIKFNEERNKFLSDKNILGGTSIEKVLDHIDHIKNLVGVDYIGIGSDFDGGITPPNELYDASCYPELTKRLVERGYTKDEII
ncbi:MAG: dipeptidase, partial [Ignavibacteria bacterium]